MKFTLSWLKDHLETDADLDAIAAALTDCGLEVEDVHDPAARYAAFTVAEVIEATPHPNADRLKLCRVATKDGEVQVVCGAPNAKTGMKAVFAPEGTYIPGTGVTLKAAEIRGVASRGMLCSERELELSDAHEGIIELDAAAQVGTPFAQVAGLDDPVINIAVTPNRQDCLGVRGIARDLAAKGLGRLKPLQIPDIAGQFDSPVSVALEFAGATADACPIFVGRTVREVKNGDSPVWMRQRLTAIGLRPISVLVDITNYVTIDLGRPLHVYDVAKLEGDIHARLGVAGESFLALDGKEYAVDDTMCVIADVGKVLGLGGIIGGEDTGVTETTTDVFIECAYFDPVRTGRTGRHLGIESDARHRFERGVDPAFVVDGARIAADWVLKLAGGVPSHAVVAGSEPVQPRTLTLRPARVAALTAVAATSGECADILGRLGFEVAADGGNLTAAVPSWRRDIDGEADLIEEIVRIKGYDQVPVTPLPRPTGVARPTLTALQRRTRRVRRALAGRGLNEAVTWSFIAPGDAMAFGGGAAELILLNPISSDMTAMRPSLLPGLLRAAARNIDRGLNPVRFFEMGAQYRDATPAGQVPVAGLVLAGDSGPRHWRVKPRAFDVFDAKAAALEVLEAAGAPIDKVQVTADAPGWYHPGRSGTIRLGPKTVLAEFGELHPGLAKTFDLGTTVAMAEIYIAAVPTPKSSASRARAAYAAPALQAVERDFAFLVKDDVTAEAVLRAARGADKIHIVEAALFDVYVGSGVPDGHKSLAVSIRLQPRKATFTDAEIEAIAAIVVAQVAKATGARLRS